MADTRATLIEAISKPRLSLAEQLIAQIDQATRLIYQGLQQAYSNGIEKPSGEDGQALFAFENVWLVINYQNFKFKSVDEVRAHYFEFENNLNKYLLNIQATSINENNKKLFCHLTVLLKEFALRQFVLSHFEENDAVTSLQQDLSAVGSLCVLADGVVAKTNLEAVEKHFELLGRLVQETKKKMVTLGYINDDQEAEKFRIDDLQLPVNLGQLPLQVDLIKLTEESNQARAADDIEKQDDCLRRIEKMVSSMREVRLGLDRELAEQFARGNALLQELAIREAELNKIKADILQYKNVARVLKLVNQIYSLSEETDPIFAQLVPIQNVCLELQPLPYRFAFGIVKSNWTLASELITNACQEVTNASRKFCESYLSIEQNNIAVFKRNNKVDQQLQLVSEAQKTLNTNATKIKQNWKTCHSALLGIEKVLIEHLQVRTESVLEASQKFIMDHWGKILTGTLSGAGASTALAAALSFPPLAFALLVIGFAGLGSSLGASTGLVFDVIENNTQPKPEPEPKKASFYLSKCFFWCHSEPEEPLIEPISLRRSSKQ